MKTTLMRTLVLQLAMLTTFGFASVTSAETVTFEGLLSPPNTFYRGDFNQRGWTVGDLTFDNVLTDFGGGFIGWEGWSYSNVVDTVTPGFENQFASAPGGGSDGMGGIHVGGTYAVAFGSGAFIDFAKPTIVQSADVTNTTYSRRTMEIGNFAAKPFGGTSGDDPDFFRVTLAGYTDVGLAGTETGSVTIDLADYTFSDNSLDFILADWMNVDLSSLGVVRSIGVSFASSDTGEFGINNPTYLALDNLQVTAIPEPSSLAVLVVVAAGGLWVRRRRQNIAQRR